jgi:nitroreductase
MTAQECIMGRRSIRKFKTDAIDHTLLESIVDVAAYAPSWKNTQITRYIAVEGALKDKIAEEGTLAWPNNGNIIHNAPLLIAITMVTGRSGFERDGSYSTSRKDGWQIYDAGIASEAFCLAAYEKGLGSVIMGIFDNAVISSLLELPEGQELMALIAVGYPDETPQAPKRKTSADLLSYKQ